jgi:hypothetical protein
MGFERMSHPFLFNLYLAIGYIMFGRVKVLVYGLLLIAVIGGLASIYIIFTKSGNIDVSNIENVEHVEVEEVIAMFKKDQEKANAEFIEKIIEVEGEIKEISFLNDRHTIILNSKSFTQSFVMCDMSPLENDKINKLTVGDTVVLRGVCKGYLLDVIMLNCIPINEKTK